MANKVQISQLPAVSAVGDDDLLVVSQGGVASKATGAQVFANRIDSTLSVNGKAANAATVGNRAMLAYRRDLIDSDDANNIKEPGTYLKLTRVTVANLPASSGVLIVFSRGTGGSYQMFLANTGKLYWRIGTNAWRQSADAAEVFTNTRVVTLDRSDFTEISDPAADLDNYTDPGNYIITSASVAANVGHMPTNRAGKLTVEKYGEGILRQTYNPASDGSNTYYRLLRSSSWSEWRTNNPWFGKTFAALGDSITWGYVPRNDPAYILPDNPGYPARLSSFASVVANRLGMNFSNHGIIGSTLAYRAARNPMCRRYNNLPDSANLITIMGGTNDIRNGIQLGTMDDRTDTTYYGALHTILGGLYKKYYIDQETSRGKDVRIVLCTPIKLLLQSGNTEGGTGTLYDLEPWAEACKKVAAYYSIPCLDFYNLSCINPHLNETVHGTVSGYTAWYNPYITDGTHPTQDGAYLMASVLEKFIQNLI